MALALALACRTPDNPGIASHILIVPDKFKGTLTARQAAEAIASGWRRSRPDDTLDLLPMSDGGDGFGEVIGDLLGAVPQVAATVDAAHRPIAASWWWHAPTATAVVESARVIGLDLLPPGAFHPFDLDTFGLGAMLAAARDAGARRCLVGVGGSATNDGGFGLARSLGWRFRAAGGAEIERWTNLDHLAAIESPDVPATWFDELIVAVDVQNPLLGPAGCSRVFGPQKGLTEPAAAERCLERLAVIAEADPTTPGVGAAGGLGFGLARFAGGRLEPGFRVFAGLADLERRVAASDLVITGEGALDAQSTMGKGVGELASLCRRSGVRCLGLAGVVRDAPQVAEAFAATFALTPDFTGVAEAMRDPAGWLERLAALAGRS
ncbi:MAG: glycerate kinase [Acidimicrobiia bacterium]|nr:glycerate kinase [Acidimicrobiia bacterium]